MNCLHFNYFSVTLLSVYVLICLWTFLITGAKIEMSRDLVPLNLFMLRILSFFSFSKKIQLKVAFTIAIFSSQKRKRQGKENTFHDSLDVELSSVNRKLNEILPSFWKKQPKYAKMSTSKLKSKAQNICIFLNLEVPTTNHELKLSLSGTKSVAKLLRQQICVKYIEIVIYTESKHALPEHSHSLDHCHGFIIC